MLTNYTAKNAKQQTHLMIRKQQIYKNCKPKCSVLLSCIVKSLQISSS